ncbi:MAG: PorP/SprF family type IX secretion system membrane protein [Chitinophagales bacterium]|nr:PorP/SprF family type IX secretion system membrane protein [Chitinophagales bacterium]
MKNKALFAFLVVLNYSLSGQQLPAWSSFYETGFVWNPALTAKLNAAEVSLTHRQDWLGFKGAPEYTNLSFQMPFRSEFYTKSAIGVFIERDKIGPQEKYGGAVTYNYRFRPQMFGQQEDVLGLGMLFNLSQYRYNISETIVYDPSGLILNLEEGSTVLNPNISLGAFYISVSEFYALQKSHYYVGLSLNQLVPSSLAKFYGRGDNQSLQKIQATPHVMLHTGYRFIPLRSKHFYEPQVMLIYGLEKSIQAMASLRYELIHKFWIAGGVATTGEVFGQAGVILGNQSFMKNVVKDGMLRIGLKSSINIGSIRQIALPGLEFYGAYVFSLE